MENKKRRMMTQKKKTYIGMVIVLAAGLLAGCSGDDSEMERAGADEIRFLVDEHHNSRATVITSNTDLQAQDIRIDAYFNGTTTAYLSDRLLHYNSTAWQFDDGAGNALHYYWPIEGSVYTDVPLTVSSLDFVGRTPIATPPYIINYGYSVSDGVSFDADLSTYMTNGAQDGLTELMYAVSTNQTKSTNSGTVNMTFQHPFACVYFQLAAGNDPNVVIKSITISGLKTGGSYTSSSGWTDLTGDGNLVITGNPATGTEAYLVIPNNNGSKTVTVTASWTDWGAQLDHDLSTTITADWSAGNSYVYSFTVRDKDLIVNTEKFTEQW